MITAACFLAVILGMGYVWWRREIALGVLVSEYDATLDSVRRDNRRLRTMLASAESDVEWARIVLADVARERDMFEAAFTAEMLRQARAELLRPDEECGLATVTEIKAGRA